MYNALQEKTGFYSGLIIFYFMLQLARTNISITNITVTTNN